MFDVQLSTCLTYIDFENIVDNCNIVNNVVQNDCTNKFILYLKGFAIRPGPTWHWCSSITLYFNMKEYFCPFISSDGDQQSLVIRIFLVVRLDFSQEEEFTIFKNHAPPCVLLSIPVVHETLF